MDDIYVDKVIAGDIEAFRYFIKTYKNMAFGVAVSIVKDDHYAEEVVQDSFLKAFGKISTYRKSGKFKSWFYRIVVNESFQRLRKIGKHFPLMGMDNINGEPGEVEFEASGDGEKMTKIQLALKALSSNESLVINLFYLEENSLKEISQITGWPLSNTKVILHRARKNLRTLLGKSV